MSEFWVACGVGVILLTVLLACVGGVMLHDGTLDSTIMADCKARGFHNYGQTKMVCSIEELK